jgi:hypothetical protein
MRSGNADHAAGAAQDASKAHLHNSRVQLAALLELVIRQPRVLVEVHIAEDLVDSLYAISDRPQNR